MSPQNENDIFDINYMLDYLNTFTEIVESQFDGVASSIQESARASSWLPEAFKPPPQSPIQRFTPQTLVNTTGLAGYLASMRGWISRHQALTAAILAFVGTGTFMIWRQSTTVKSKRRALRCFNGARCEVVVLVGSPSSALTRIIALDLERRGFIVFIPVTSAAERNDVLEASRPEIRPLDLDISSPESLSKGVRELSNILQHKTSTTTNEHPFQFDLHLTAFILLPPAQYPHRTISTLPAQEWSSIMTTNLLFPFTILHAFLPLLQAQESSLITLQPAINTALTTPLHAPECVTASAMQSFTSVLRKETANTSLNIVTVKLGKLDLTSTPHSSTTSALVPYKAFGQSEPTRAEFTKQRLSQHRVPNRLRYRELNDVLFDIIARDKGRNGTVFVGQAARTYDLIGRWAPSSLIAYMLGVGKRDYRRNAQTHARVGRYVAGQWYALRDWLQV